MDIKNLVARIKARKANKEVPQPKPVLPVEHPKTANQAQAEPEPQALPEHPERDDSALLQGRCAYKLATPYGQAWLVADDQAKARLHADRVSETVYTLAEAQEFIKLPVEQRAYVHMVKAVMSGTVEVVSPFCTATETHSATVQKDTFKYRVLKPLELHGQSYQPGDVVELSVDEAQVLLQDNSIQAACYWARSDDLSAQGYQ
jgi:hypothetical protein